MHPRHCHTGRSSYIASTEKRKEHKRMQYLTETITCSTTSPIEIIDITKPVKNALAASGLRQGRVTLVSRHTTAFVNINEHEPVSYTHLRAHET